MSLLLARLDGEGIGIYRLAAGSLEKVASGPVSELKPIRELGRKILIVGKDLLFYARKKYPPLSDKNLANAVRIDLEDLFPLKEASHFLKVLEKAEAYVIADIWAWPRSLETNVAKVFPFTSVVPEDMAFFSNEPELSIFGGLNGLTNMVAHDRQGYIGSLSFADHRLTDQQRAIFVRSLSREAGRIRRIHLFDGDSRDAATLLAADLGAEVRTAEALQWPASVDQMARQADLALHPSRTSWDLAAQFGLPLRILLYLVVIYGLVLALSNRNYTNALDEVTSRLEGLSKETRAAALPVKGSNDADAVKKISDRMAQHRNPLVALDVLARSLPPGAYVTRFVANDQTIDISVATKEPLKVIKVLSAAPEISRLKLVGSPPRDAATGRSTLTLQMEIK